MLDRKGNGLRASCSQKHSRLGPVLTHRPCLSAPSSSCLKCFPLRPRVALGCFGCTGSQEYLSGHVWKRQAPSSLHRSLPLSAPTVSPAASELLQKQPDMHWDPNQGQLHCSRDEPSPGHSGTLTGPFPWWTPGRWQWWQEVLCGDSLIKSPFKNGVLFSRGWDSAQPNSLPRRGSEDSLLSTEGPIF